MNTRWFQIALLTLSLTGLLLVSGCGGGATGSTLDDQTPGLAAEEGWVGSSTLRDTSGAPSGVRVIWGVVSDDTVTGYHLYKSDLPIPDSARGDDSFWVDNDGSPVFTQPASLDVTEVTFDDVFTVSIGEVYYYRVSSLATDGSESLLSEPLVVTIADFSVSGLSETSVAGGEDFIIYGENFGMFDVDNDGVTVRGVDWVWGAGFVLSDLECPIVDWQLNAIQATLPAGATSGRVEVTVNGVMQTSLQSVMNSNPFITHCSHLTADPGDVITLSGSNFGGPADPNNRVVFGTLELTNPSLYDIYTGDMIMFETPSLPAGLYEVNVVVDDAVSNTAYIEIGDTVGPTWGHTWGTSLTDAATGICAGESTDVYLAGYSQGLSANPYDAVVVKYDAGTLAWARYWNNTDNTEVSFREESLNDICYNSGYVYAAGTCLDSSGNPCVLLLCYGIDGVFQYARQWGSGSTAMAMGDAIACDGTNVYIAGSYTDADGEVLLVSYALDGTFVNAQIWNPTANSEMGYDIAVDGNGDLIAIGSTTDAFGTSLEDLFILKTSNTLSKIWAVYWGTSEVDTPSVVSVDATDNILVGGSSAYWMTADVIPFLVTFDSSGSVVSEYEWDVSGSATFIGLDFNSTGDLYGVMSRWPSDPDVMFVGLDPTDMTCNLGWEFYSDTYLPIGTDATVNNLDHVLFCGTATSMNGDWQTYSLSGTLVDEGTQTQSESSTDLATASGSSTDLTGTDAAASGTEDVGAGADDVLVHAIIPE